LVPEDPDSDIEDRDEALQPDLTEAQRNKKDKIAHLIDHLPQELWDAFLDDAVQPRVEAISERAVLASLLFGLLLQLVRGLPGNGANTRPNAAVAAHPDLRARLATIPRHSSDANMVDHVGKQLETAFSNMLTLLFAGRLKKSVSLAGAKRGLLGLEEGEEVDDDKVEDPAKRGRLLRHAVHTTREMEAAMAAWQLDMVPWQQAELTNPGLLPRPPRPPTPYAITPTSECRARHVFIDTRGLYGMMRDAGMLGVLTEEGVTSLAKFRNGALPDPARPGHWSPPPLAVANRWDALLPDPRRQKLASPKHSFAQIVHTDGVALSVMFLRPKPAAPPVELPRMGKHMGAVNPLAHLDAEWLGVDPGKTNMATVAHEERSAAGTVVSVWQRTLTAGQYYRDSGITQQTQATKTWLAKVKPQLTALSRVRSKPSSLASYRQFADTVLATYDTMWAEFPTGRVVMVDEFRTSRVSSAYSHPSEALPGQPPESFRWLQPVYSKAKRSRVRGLMCSTSNNIRFYDRDVSAALNIRRCAVGPGPRPTELCYWDGRPAMPKPGRPGQEWVYLLDKALLRKWRRKWRR
ncbi:hypothetical protein QJQ45_030284, partial [Haematococcus lacustris]